MPTKHYTQGKANLTQAHIIKEHIDMSWFYDYPNERMLEMWESDHSIQYPYPDARAHYDGKKGTYEIYMTKLKHCIKFDFGMGIPRPDSFVPSISNASVVGRECHLGYWADHYSVYMGGKYGSFDAWFHIDTAFPLEFNGITIPTIRAAFQHTNMVPMFEYQDSKKPNITGDITEAPKLFFPEFLGSWDALDKLFTDFESHKGNCLPVADLFDQYISNSSDDHLSTLMKSYQDILASAPETPNFGYF